MTKPRRSDPGDEAFVHAVLAWRALAAWVRRQPDPVAAAIHTRERLAEALGLDLVDLEPPAARPAAADAMEWARDPAVRRQWQRQVAALDHDADLR